MKIIKLLGLLLLIFFIIGCSNNPIEEINDYIPADIIGVWQIQFAENATDGTDYPIQWLYGSGIRYGGSFRFNDDGTFSRYVGITTNIADDYEGTFSVNGNDITLNFGNGSVGTARFLPERQLIECHRWEAWEIPVYVYFARDVEEVLSVNDGRHPIDVEYSFAIYNPAAFFDGAELWCTASVTWRQWYFSTKWNEEMNKYLDLLRERLSEEMWHYVEESQIQWEMFIGYNQNLTWQVYNKVFYGGSILQILEPAVYLESYRDRALFLRAAYDFLVSGGERNDDRYMYLHRRF